MVGTETVTEGNKTKRSVRRSRVGVVKSDKADKTITVVCDYKVKHRIYGKYVGRRTVLYAHDERNEAKEGDRVEVMECRPLSKVKNWRLVRVVAQA